MCHDWILDVLADLRSYALKNDLPRLAAEVASALRVAGQEIAAAHCAAEAADDEASDEGAPPKDRRH